MVASLSKSILTSVLRKRFGEAARFEFVSPPARSDLSSCMRCYSSENIDNEKSKNDKTTSMRSSSVCISTLIIMDAVMFFRNLTRLLNSLLETIVQSFQ